MDNPLPFWPTWATPQVMWGGVVGLLALAGLMKLGLSRAPKVRPLDEAGRVVGFVGRMGSGKSYAMVAMAVEQLKAGADVATNFGVHVRHDERCAGDCDRPVIEGGGEWSLFRSLDDFEGLKGTFQCRRCKAETRGVEWCCGRPNACVRRVVVMVDEAQDLFSSDAGKLPPVARFALKNGRKDGRDTFWATQHEGGVHVRLRALTNEIGVCRSRRSRRSGRVFEMRMYEPQDVRKPGKELYKLRRKFDPFVGGLYSTAEIIEPDEYLVDERLGRAMAAREAQVRAGGRNRSQFAQEMGLNDHLAEGEGRGDGARDEPGALPWLR